MTDRAVIALTATEFESDDLVVFELIDHRRFNGGTFHEGGSHMEFAIVGDEEDFRDFNCRAGFDIEFLDFDLTAGFNAVLFPACLDDCVCHKVFPVKEGSIKMKGQKYFARVKTRPEKKFSDMAEKKTRVLILGSQGRLAASLLACWSKSHEVIGLSRPELDVSDLNSLPRILGNQEFDVLVNGTGLTNVDRCECAREEAQLVNAHAPGILARCASQQGARLIHFSTDYVFDGKKREAYTEEDTPSPLGFYGVTKLEGERRVLEQDARHLVVRVSWVFGSAKPSFPDSLIERAMRSDRVEAIEDKFSCPTSASDTAKWLEIFFDPTLEGGLFHACNSGQCSWREYGAKALEFAAEAGLELRANQVAPIRLAEMKQFIAQRPVFSILSTRKLAAAAGLTPRYWHEALSEYIFEKYAPISSPT